MTDLPPEALNDPCGPPKTSVVVGCIHCGEEFDSYQMWWREEIVNGERRGFWCCPTRGCSGAGFGIDIWPVDPDYVDERTGEKFCITFDDDDYDFEDDEDFDDEFDEDIADDADRASRGDPEFNGNGSGFGAGPRADDEDIPW